MPLPTPNDGETKKDFLDRCMANPTMNEDFKDNKQRYAVCQSQWEKDKKSADDDREARVLLPVDAEIRIEQGKDEKPKLVGYAAKYGVSADIGWFKEKIKAGAFDEALKSSDARAQFNHDPNLLLGRESSGTLRLSSNSVGLRFEIDMPETSTGRDVLELVKRGDIQGCSFAFTVAEEEWTNKENEPSERTIVRVGQLYDVGPVTFPAYVQTTVAARSLEHWKQEHPPQTPAEKSPTISPERQRAVDVAYRKTGRILSRLQAAKLRLQTPGRDSGHQPSK